MNNNFSKTTKNWHSTLITMDMHRSKNQKPDYCLSDFIAPKESGKTEIGGLVALTSLSLGDTRIEGTLKIKEMKIYITVKVVAGLGDLMLRKG